MALLALGLSAHLFVAAGDVTVALPTFSATADVPPAKRDFFLEYFSQQLSAKGGLSVITPSQIAAVMGMERQRELLGCAETSCTAELAGALGTEAIVVGSVAKVGDDFAVTLKALDSKTSKVITSASGRGKKEEAVLDSLAQAATQIHDELLLRLRGQSPAGAAASRGSRFGPGVLIPGIVGVASLITSGVLFGVVKGAQSRLETGDPTVGDAAAAHQLATTGSSMQIASAVTLGLGIAALATAAFLFFLLGGSR